MRVALREALSRSGHNITTAPDGDEGFRLFDSSNFDLVISDVRMPKMDGLSFLARVREKSSTPFVLITAYASVDDAVTAMRKGATDYLLKPFSFDTLEELLARIFVSCDSGQPLVSTSQAIAQKEKPGRKQGPREIVTANERMKKALDIANRVAPSKSSVLIHGESGVGKELVARYIHEHSDRNTEPFVAVNCAALPESLLESELFGHEKGSFTGAIGRKIGKFEMADRGTILLDEITEMESSLQAKLLRVLQEHEVDRVGGKEPISLNIRVIATTNRDMDKAVAEGKFREDLFFRLNVIPLYLPPLRERKEDIPILVAHFIRKFNAIMGKAVEGVEPSALEMMKQRTWRGNIRELENAMERSVLLCYGDLITEEDLMLGPAPTDANKKAESSKEPDKAGMTVAEMEKSLIFNTLDAVKWNRTRAADTLGISIRTLRNKLNDYKVHVKEEELSALEENR